MTVGVLTADSVMAVEQAGDQVAEAGPEAGGVEGERVGPDADGVGLLAEMTVRLASGDCSTYCRCGGSATCPAA